MLAVDLGTFGWDQAQGLDINNNGDIVGFVLGPTNPITFLQAPQGWFVRKADGTVTITETLPVDWPGTFTGSYFEPSSINDAGEMTGAIEFVTLGVGTGAHAAFRAADGTVTDLGTAGGASAQGYSINNSGDVAGAIDVSGTTHVLFCPHGGSASDLGAFGYDSAYGVTIDDAGNILIAANTAGVDAIVVRAADGSYAAISDPATFNLSGSVRAMNPTQIVGTLNSDTHAVLVSHAGVLTDLGTFGATAATGNAINNNGDIVGYYDFGCYVRFADTNVFQLGVAGGATANPYSVSNLALTGALTTVAGKNHVLYCVLSETPPPPTGIGNEFR